MLIYLISMQIANMYKQKNEEKDLFIKVNKQIMLQQLKSSVNRKKSKKKSKKKNRKKK